MATDRFDQTARFTARFDPEGFLAWLIPGLADEVRFERWLDTRAAPMPGLANQTADTVAELHALREVGPPWLLLLEFQTEPDPDMFGRLLGQLGKFWREQWPDELPGSRYQLVAAVVNLTGTKESAPSSRAYEFPLGGLGLKLTAEERHLATESAAATLEAIARGETAKSLLSFVPLMTGGGEPGIIERWLEIAGAVPDHRRRSELGTLSLTIDLKPWCDEWRKALREWNMRESTFVQGWIDEGIEKGRILALQQMLRTQLAKRFGSVPPEVVRRIEATTDLGTLDRAVEKILDIARAEDLLD